jgi:hypothetical protein
MNSNPFLFDSLLIFQIVGIWVTYSMLTKPFHNSRVTAPIQRPITHMMVRRIVNDTGLSFTPGRVVNISQKAPSHLNAEYRFSNIIYGKASHNSTFSV